jgi:hypothetical protein
MRHLRALLAALALLLALALSGGTAPAGANHEWVGPQVPAPCVASTGSDCQP